MSDEPLVRVDGLRKWYPIRRGFLASLFRRSEAQHVKAVDGVDFEIRRGEVLGLAGESGAGKSTIGRLILRLIEPTGGTVLFDGRDMSSLSAVELRRLRNRMQVVFQDPLASLNPRMTIGRAIMYRARLSFVDMTEEDRRRAVLDVLQQVGLDPPEGFYSRYPHQVSGGQRQRAVIARALLTRPDLIVFDEPIAMADVSVRSLLLDLLKRLKQEFGLTYLYITHDLATAKYLCDRIAILYLGRIVEIGPIDEVFTNSQHPYTRSLLAAVPVPDPNHRRSVALPQGEIPDPINPPSGCRFHPRCPMAQRGICDVEEPNLEPRQAEHRAACHFTTGRYSASAAGEPPVTRGR